ncbi:DUF1294 domain-containing protein [Croceicoccus naphthovorans]|uniref:Cold-shock protein n=2 Tax=Croceicoccus naphthovorans TaxID=1348774 RepID=A0A0G3XHN1_9SPHN|nr:DUF1294 domain-containing protein [Croceicoccus naphthovorans]AKM10126.1 cold-shock protein [Croceicoccus naphthovorans]MBB3991586.1 uncharacterized membrane protein YsdA (DUF1294 family) [Croceicoccus naphthovorans]
MLAWILPVLALLNLWTFLQFRRDKLFAIDGARRIPEADLLMLALLGGTAGAFAGRKVFRHKTRKEPFSTYLQIIATLQIGAIIGFFVI